MSDNIRGDQRATSNHTRPRVICHMMASVDGRIGVEGWPLSEDERAEYERVHDSYGADGWLVGRVTLEQHFAAGVRSDAELAREHEGGPRDDFVAPGGHESYAVAVDARGKLLWDSGDLEGDHLVAADGARVGRVPGNAARPRRVVPARRP